MKFNGKQLKCAKSNVLHFANKDEADYFQRGEVEDSGSWRGVPIVLEKGVSGFDNPITIADVIAVFELFSMSEADLKGLDSIIISGKSNNVENWAFGAYLVVWDDFEIEENGIVKKARVAKEKNIVLFAQKFDRISFMWDGDKREGNYYRIHPMAGNEQMDRYISKRTLRQEVLGNTLCHEIGHHVDVFYYGRNFLQEDDMSKSEFFASSYASARAKGRLETEEFITLVDGDYILNLSEIDNREKKKDEILEGLEADNET